MKKGRTEKKKGGKEEHTNIVNCIVKSRIRFVDNANESNKREKREKSEERMITRKRKRVDGEENARHSILLLQYQIK